MLLFVGRLPFYQTLFSSKTSMIFVITSLQILRLFLDRPADSSYIDAGSRTSIAVDSPFGYMPRNRKFRSLPVISENLITNGSDGAEAPFSTLLMYLDVQPISSDSFSCVKPWSSRAVLRRLPMDFLSISMVQRTHLIHLSHLLSHHYFPFGIHNFNFIDLLYSPQRFSIFLDPHLFFRSIL